MSNLETLLTRLGHLQMGHRGNTMAHPYPEENYYDASFSPYSVV